MSNPAPKNYGYLNKFPTGQRDGIKIMLDRLAALERATAGIGSVSQPLSTNLDAANNRLTGVADPTHAQDAVNLQTLTTQVLARIRQAVVVLPDGTQVNVLPSAPPKRFNTSSIPGGGGTVPGIPPDPPGTPPPGGGGTPTPPPTAPPTAGSLSGATDAFSLAGATIYNSPLDIATWPITTTITNLTWYGDPANPTNGGIQLTFSAQNRPGGWPDYTPPGWNGPLQYTLWIFFFLGGHWYGSGIIQYWYIVPPGIHGGGPLNIAPNWVYAARWGAMQGHQPAQGETVGFMVSAGDARGINAVTSVKERSQVATIAFPPPSGGIFT